MSADSPRRSGTGSRVTRQSGVPVTGNGFGQVVVPVPVTDPSIIDSVTGFINDVVPQAYTTTPSSDGKEAITWARFESADVNDPALYPDVSSDTTLPLLLVLGYSTGVQVWSIPASGEATEVLSWSQGSVRTLRILPSPASNSMRSPDAYASKRPLVALCDSAGPGPGPPFCSVSFISLKTGDQVKSIKFKNQVCDVLANRRSVVVTFLERIAVFDACTLEDRLSITSCYPSPGPNCNPVTIGSRWLAFAEKKLVAWQRSSGGVGGSGTQSYTATVLHAAQTLGRGLRGLSETVASSLTGPRNHSGSGAGSLGSSPPSMNGADHNTPGVVTVLDLEASCSRHNGSEDMTSSSSLSSSAEGVVAHFVAHSEAIVALQFDPSGMLLVTADRRGHNFHVFRIQPHPGGSSLSAVHHLYVLHRGDTSAKVQDVAFSCDSRWVAVSTMRGTTHVFPLTPYGGPVGFRTHGSPHVVNRLSRFHRSAGLSADGRSSPVPSPESPPCLPAGPHANPRLPPYPHATVQAPLSQLRQSPHPPLAPAGALDVSVRVCAAFASPRTWLLESHTPHPREGPGPRDSTKALRRAVDSLFVMTGHGNLVQYDLEPVPVLNGPREKICDDTPIELEVEARAQWLLQRSPHSPEVLPPLPSNNPLLCGPVIRVPNSDSDSCQQEEHWLSQVEIITHAGPHRRLWMGPQITFKTYTTNVGCNASLHDVEAVEVGTVPVSRPARSNPVNMPSGGRPLVPVLIESGSGSSLEQSPHLLEVYGADTGDTDNWSGQGDSRLREDLADAMLESPGAPAREKGKRRYYGLVGGGGGEGEQEQGEGRVVRGGTVRRVVNPGGAEITMWSDGEVSDSEQQDLAEHLWEAIAIPAHLPAPPCHSLQPAGAAGATTIPASRSGNPGVTTEGEGEGEGEEESSTQVNVLVVAEASRQKSRRVVEITEPPPVCKKSKKNNSTAPDREAPRKSKAGKAQKMAEDDCAVECEASPEAPAGKKGKKPTAFEDDDDGGITDSRQKAKSKSPSPQKEILDVKGGKRPAFSSEKGQGEDSSSSLSKKNKKKVSSVANDKNDGIEFECQNNEQHVAQCGRGKSSCTNSEVPLKASIDSIKSKEPWDNAGLENSNERITCTANGCKQTNHSSLPLEPSNDAFRGNKKRERVILPASHQNQEDENSIYQSKISQSETLDEKKILQENSGYDFNSMSEDQNCDNAIHRFNIGVERDGSSSNMLTVGDIERDIEEAVVDVVASKSKSDYNKRAACVVIDTKNPNWNVNNNTDDASSNENSNAIHSLKQFSSESEENQDNLDNVLGQKFENCATSSERFPKAVTKAWKVLKETHPDEDLKNFPVLSSKFNKKAWALSGREATCANQRDCVESPEKEFEVIERKTKIKDSLMSESTCTDISAPSEKQVKDRKSGGVLTAKSKNTCKVPVSGNNAGTNQKKPLLSNTKADIDIEKMTFEDLEAIVDAVCKEEDIENEKTCLKENEKKKSESSTVSNCSKKGRGKENVEEDSCGRAHDVAVESEVTSATKIAPEEMKQEEPVKPIEKAATTPNKTSKSQRRKRR